MARGFGVLLEGNYGVFFFFFFSGRRDRVSSLGKVEIGRVS